MSTTTTTTTRTMNATDQPTSQDKSTPMDPPAGEDRPVNVVAKAEPKRPKPSILSMVKSAEHSYRERNKVREMAEVVKMLEIAGVPCCMVAESALVYYGTGRVMIDWMMCVPTEHLDKAADLIRAEKERFEPSMRSANSRVNDISHLYPRFKLKGTRLCLTLLASEACHIVCDPQNIEHSDNGIPYPQLHVFAQSLLDTRNFVDLDDLIDGMNLTPEWGEQNLHLDGTVDGDWLRWRKSRLLGREPTENELINKLPERRETWMEMASAEAKKRRQGIKYIEGMVTRWRVEGGEDPRIKTRRFC